MIAKNKLSGFQEFGMNTFLGGQVSVPVHSYLRFFFGTGTETCSPETGLRKMCITK